MTARDEMDAAFETSVTQLRVPPQAIEAEQAILGGLLLDNGAWDRVGDMLAGADFYRHDHRLVYDAISSLVNANRPADVITVNEFLKSQGKADEVGGMAYLHSLAQYVPGASNIRRHAQLVRERSLARQLISASDELATLAFAQTVSVDEMVEKATGQLLRLTEGRARDEWASMESMIVPLLDRLQDGYDGTAKPDFTPTGLKALDERLDGGMRAGELIVIGARPGMGKTALGLTIAANVAETAGLGVGFFSMEMPKEQVAARIFSMRSAIHLSRIKRPERLRDLDWAAITSTVERLRNVPVFIADQSNLNINQLRAKARALRRKTDALGCIVVDYLGLMRGTDPKVPRTYQLEEVSQGLKALAKEMRVPVILLVQLNRKVEERTDQLPILSDIRDSGSVEQDADIIFFIHRPIKANPLLGDEWKYYAKGYVAKVRDGESGYLDLMYVGENTHFMDWPEGREVPTSRVMTKRGADL